MEEDLKSFGRKLVRVVNSLAALSAAVFFIIAWLGNPPNVSPGFLAVCGVGVLFLNVVRILYFRSGKRADEAGPLSSMTDDGIVHVSREAVESGLRAAGEGLSDVTRLRVKVLTPGRRRHRIRAHYLAPEGVQILEVGSKLRRALLDRFGELVRVDEGKLEVEMIFEGFYGKAKGVKRPEPEPEPEPEVSEPAEPEAPPPFTGPRYPIDAEGEVS